MPRRLSDLYFTDAPAELLTIACYVELQYVENQLY